MTNSDLDDPNIVANTLTFDVHESIRDSFIPLPDISVKLTAEQLEALFPHPEAFRDMVGMTIRKLKSQVPTTSDAA